MLTLETKVRLKPVHCDQHSKPFVCQLSAPSLLLLNCCYRCFCCCRVIILIMLVRTKPIFVIVSSQPNHQHSAIFVWGKHDSVEMIWQIWKKSNKTKVQVAIKVLFTPSEKPQYVIHFISLLSDGKYNLQKKNLLAILRQSILSGASRFWSPPPPSPPIRYSTPQMVFAHFLVYVPE